MKQIKTIDINAKEWFDRINGNSYFAGTVTTDYGTTDEKRYVLPFQYGYGSQYEWEAARLLEEAGVIQNRGVKSPSQFYRDNGIILRRSLVSAKKSELKAIK